MLHIKPGDTVYILSENYQQGTVLEVNESNLALGKYPYKVKPDNSKFAYWYAMDNVLALTHSEQYEGTN